MKKGNKIYNVLIVLHTLKKIGEILQMLVLIFLIVLGLYANDYFKLIGISIKFLKISTRIT